MTPVTQSLPATAGVDLSIGADSQGSQHYFNGDVDDVAVYDRALTDGEIRESAGRVCSSQPGGLLRVQRHGRRRRGRRA
jgi:hypothetical protein